MKRVEEDDKWTLMCPNECPGLQDCHGDEFDKLYLKYESQKKGRKTIRARDLWDKILESQIETGTPYMLYKDAANRKSNNKINSIPSCLYIQAKAKTMLSKIDFCSPVEQSSEFKFLLQSKKLIWSMLGPNVLRLIDSSKERLSKNTLAIFSIHSFSCKS